MKIEQGKTFGHYDGSLSMKITFDESMLHVTQTSFGTIIDIDECTSSGPPGGPHLPSKIIRIALPPLTLPVTVSGEQLKTISLSHDPVFLAPIQLFRPGINNDVPHPDKKSNIQEQKQNVKPSTVRPVKEEPFVEPFPAPPIVPPKEELYDLSVERPLVRLITTEGFELLPVAIVEVNPVRVLKNGSLEFYSEIHIALAYESINTQQILGKKTNNGNQTISLDSTITSHSQAKRMIDLVRAQVVNPHVVFDFSRLIPDLITNVDYLIITDNHSWDEKSIRPKDSLDGNLVSIFQRLADWKATRGLKAIVITVTDIVNGTYGNFTKGARDLQEVIRNFLKWAYSKWGISWLLLGGDIDIIPVRIVAGALEGGIELKDTEPPLDNKCFWTGSFLKMKVVAPGVWWPGSSTDHLLIRYDTGLLIPYDAAGTSGPTTRGWYFTTDETYTERSAFPSQYVVVNGPEAEIKGTLLQWLYQWNMLPTDLYYSSLFGKKYNVPSKHDWDLLDNGIYGQHIWDVDFDGVQFKADISVGRAPVYNTKQVTAFVDKVIAYEQFRRPDGISLHRSWPRHMLFASTNWGGRLWIGPTSDDPPTDNRYHHSTGKSYSLIKLEKPFEDIKWRLFVSVTDSDVRIMDYDRNAAKTGRGWYFAKSESDLTGNQKKIHVYGKTHFFPEPTMWIVVYGSAVDLSPEAYIFDRKELDGSLHDQEELRQQISRDLPGINTISRLYEDEIDLSPTDIAAAPLEHITETRLRDFLNLDQHFVSLSGHGSPNGCCFLSRDMAQDLSNGYHTFIAYADSCLTNQFDGEDAMSENIIYNSNGGAVAYIGNTRFSWIGVGDDFQRAFFKRLISTRHLGLLNDIRCSIVNESPGSYTKWATFTLNLIGDPEMPVWTQKPPSLKIRRIPRLLDRRKPFTIKVERSFHSRDEPLEGAVVYIHNEDFSCVIFTDSEGIATFDINVAKLGRLDIVVTYDGFVPFIDFVQVNGPEWITGLVTDVLHQHETEHQSLVRLQLDNPIEGNSSRAWYARDSIADYGIILDAVTDAYVSGKKISLYVDNLDEGGTIERFRFF
jgi:hypothetical protein